MPIFLSSYNTTFGRRYAPDAARAAIVKAVVSDYLTKNKDSYTVINDSTDYPVDIPTFSHPLYVDKHPNDGIYVDARPYVSRNRLTGEIKINSTADYNLALARAGLEQIWRKEPPEVMRRMSPLPASVYASWLSENIGKKFGLEPEDQYKLQIFSAWMYYSLFTNEVTPTDDDYMHIVQGIHKATKIDPAAIMEVLDGQDYVANIAEYCDRLEEVVGNVRLRGFTPILLLPTLNPTWYGSNSNEMVAIALEHIPTFFSIVLAAVTERSYARSRLSTMIERVPAKGSIDDFKLQMTATLKSH